MQSLEVLSVDDNNISGADCRHLPDATSGHMVLHMRMPLQLRVDTHVWTLRGQASFPRSTTPYPT